MSSVNNAFKRDLLQANNLEEFFAVCGKYYDLKGSKLGPIAKGIMVANIDKIITMSGAKPKK